MVYILTMGYLVTVLRLVDVNNGGRLMAALST